MMVMVVVVVMVGDDVVVEEKKRGDEGARKMEGEKFHRTADTVYYNTWC